MRLGRYEERCDMGIRDVEWPVLTWNSDLGEWDPRLDQSAKTARDIARVEFFPFLHAPREL